MPKNAGESRSKTRFTSTRKPLRDVSNAKTAVKPASIHKKISEEDRGQTGENSLDRLLLVHSDLSSLLRQIDELVVQALQFTGDDRRKDIKQFADVLFDMKTSLKPWVSRFQTVQSRPTETEKKSEQPMEKEALSVSKECENTAIDSPEETKWESLVSPSPLVSWRAGCNTGRQLFLLTPLPQKMGFSSKHEASSRHPVEKIPSDKDFHEGVSAKLTPKVAFDAGVTKAAAGNLLTACASPERVSNKNCSLFVMTPCMKMSPPKSCILIEPISAFSTKKSQLVHKSTSFPTGVQRFSESQDSESSTDQSSDDLKLKYPELYGINKENMQKRTAAEDSPDWIVSPPKTCIIIDPSNEPLLKNHSDNCLPLKTTNAVSHEEKIFPSMKIKEESKGGHATTSKRELQDVIRTLDLAEFTPMMKGPMSIVRMGKHPGENTLKKELWTKFEAATTNGFCFSNSIVEDSNKKGFLDILDEVSDDE